MALLYDKSNFEKDYSFCCRLQLLLNSIVRLIGLIIADIFVIETFLLPVLHSYLKVVVAFVNFAVVITVECF